MPDDSNWNTPTVNPLENNSYTLGSSKGILFISIFLPKRLLTRSIVLSITVKFRNPRKSIFKRPNFSSSFISYCVVISSLVDLYNGTKSVNFPGATTTPAA